MDEVALYAAPLSATQVARHHVMRLANGIDMPVELALVASDANGDMLTFSATGLPPGLTIAPATGLITGTLTKTAAGIYHVTASVSDGSLTHSQSFQWTVTHINRAPQLTTIATQTDNEGTNVTRQVHATDEDGDTLAFSTTGLPGSLTMASATGVISGALSYTTAGIYPVTVVVSDGTTTVAQTFTWTVVNVNGPPALSNPGPQHNSDSLDYVQAVRADGAAAHWRLDDAAGAAADGIGQHTGTRYGLVAAGEPGALADGPASNRFNGSNAFVRVPNAAALQLTGDLTIELWVNVSLAARQTLISKNYLREFELTLEKSGALNLYHGNGATSNNVLSTAGAVLPNLWQHVVVTRRAATKTVSFYVNRVAKGGGTYLIAPTAGTNGVSIGRSEHNVQFVNGRLDEVAIYPAAISPDQVASHYLLASHIAVPTSVGLQLFASDPDNDAITFSAAGLPHGLSLNAQTGLISGNLSRASAGTHTVTATATAGSHSDTQTFTWSISHINPAPQLGDPGAHAAIATENVSLALVATDWDGDVLSFSATGLPASVTLDVATGLISGAFPAAGVYVIAATATDGTLSSGRTFAWTVARFNHAPLLTNPGAQTSSAIFSYQGGGRARRPSGLLAPARRCRTHCRGCHEPPSRDGHGWRHDGPGAPLADGSQAMGFNGVNSYVRVPNAAALQLSGDLTLELWINVAAGVRQTLISRTT